MVQGLEAVKLHAEELSSQYGVKTEVRDEGGQIYIILKDVELPTGVYNLPKTDVLFFTDHQYPLSAPDMFWVHKDLLLADGAVPKNADEITQHIGEQWRRFSWHHNNPNINTTTNGLIQHFEIILERWRRDLQPC